MIIHNRCMVLLLWLPYRTGEISYMLQYALFLKFGSLYSLA
jgi:hypothetical protein